MPNIDITVKNKIASGVPGQFVVCGNSDFTIRFSFDSEWDGYSAKTARFIWAEGFEDVNFIGSDCPMPVIANTNNVVIGVYAGEQLHTTTPAVVVAKKSILCGNAESSHTIITKGAKGDPGVSPSISVTDITGGHRVTIVDAEHGIEDPITFDVMDGDSKVVEIFASPGKSAYTASELRAMIGTYHFYFSSDPVSFIWYEGDESKVKFSVLVGGENQLHSILYSVDESKNLAIVSMTNTVPDTRKVNNKALSSDITITEADIPNLEDHLQEIDDELTEARQDVTQALTEVERALGNKQDTLIAGENITIENNVISASGSGELLVTVTEQKGVYTSNKTFAEIKEAWLAKRHISVLCVHYYNGGIDNVQYFQKAYIPGAYHSEETLTAITFTSFSEVFKTNSRYSIFVSFIMFSDNAGETRVTAFTNGYDLVNPTDFTALQQEILGVEDLIGDGGLNDGD